VFVKLCWKSLIGTNTVAYYESLLITDKKRFITLGPGLSTLRKWIHRFQCEPGIQTQILRLMQEQMRSSSMQGYNAASLAFDEMEIKKVIQYDAKQDQIVGPFKKLQLVVLRGIVSNWKQQIYYDFDQPMTKDLLQSIIISAEEHGIQVFNIVCDLGNQGLLKSLGVTPSKPFFDNPFCPSRRIFVFPDAPHLLKLLRNHLLDKGYILSDGTEIQKDDIQQILAKDCQELKIHHKLLPIHFNCVSTTRQRVCLAAQLISHTTATAIQCLSPEKKKLADWIEMFDQWFDILNSRIPFHSKKMACGYGVHLEEQNSTLERVFACVESMREIGRRGYLPFQRGFLISIRSLQGLYSDLKQNFGIKYLLTSRLNQDSAENTFSQIRGIGSPHPGPVDCKHRLRLIMLGKNGNVLVQQPSVLLEKGGSMEENIETAKLIMEDMVANVHPDPI
jgi:hypothetical protein